LKRLLLCLVCLAGSAWAQDAALRTLDTCRARLDPRLDIGIERVQQRCPELLPALQRAPWKELLPTALGQRREEISAESLRALAELVRHSQDPGTQRSTPPLDSLAPVLAELGAQGKQGATRWERFKRWLREKFERRRGPAEQGWLDRLRGQLSSSEGVMRALTYVCYGLVIALVLFVIVAELRAAGLLGGLGRAGRRAAAAAEWRRRLLLTDILAAPLSERPGLLLRLLGEALTRAHRLPAADGLTAAALVRRARLEEQLDREALARVAGAAEQRRYAAQPPADAELEGAVDTARDLLGRLARLPEARS
jgi:hypothetical protein